MAILPSAPIALFDEYFDPKGDDYLPIVEKSSGKTLKIKATYFGQTAPSTNYKWVSGFNYPVDAIVDFAGQWYLSLQTPNLGKTPTANPAYWELQTKSPAGFVFWQAGVYTGDPILVLYTLDGVTSIYMLADATRPYLSEDFEAELTAGDWAIIGAGSAGFTRESHRVFTEELLFDKNEIYYDPYEMTADLNFVIATTGNLINQTSSMNFELITDGTHAIYFNSFPGRDFAYIYPQGILSGVILPAGTFEIYMIYENGKCRVNIPGVSNETSGLQSLLAPPNFAVVANGQNQLDFTWDDVANETGYQVERSTTGTGSWTLYSNPAADATSDNETGLIQGTTVFYRIKSLGDGVSYADSPYAYASGTTEDTGDVTAPTFVFSPANGNTWTVNAPAVITANEELRNSADNSIIDSTDLLTIITLKETNSGGANIPFTATIDVTKTVITVTPTAGYGANQLVYLAINNVEDVSGNAISLQSITFTTTEMSFLNGTSNRLQFGDIMDSVLTATDTNFWWLLTARSPAASGARMLVTKYHSSANERCIAWYYSGADMFCVYWKGPNYREIKWAGAISDALEHVWALKYNGALDTNDGLDRLVLEKDGVPVGSKTLLATGGGSVGTAINNLQNTTSQLAVGAAVAGAGTGSSFFTEELKDFKFMSGNGTVTEIDVPIIFEGTDVSGNARNGTWG